MVTTNQGVQQAYNAQIVVDAQEGVIIGTALSAHPNDVREFEPALEAVEVTTGRTVAQVTADAGSFSKTRWDFAHSVCGVLRRCEANGRDGCWHLISAKSPGN